MLFNCSSLSSHMAEHIFPLILVYLVDHYTQGQTVKLNHSSRKCRIFVELVKVRVAVQRLLLMRRVFSFSTNFYNKCIFIQFGSSFMSNTIIKMKLLSFFSEEWTKVLMQSRADVSVNQSQFRRLSSHLFHGWRNQEKNSWHGFKYTGNESSALPTLNAKI